MDKNLNSSPPRPPWWIIAVQVTPLVLQLVLELINRYQGNSNLELPQTPCESDIPGPIDPRL